MTDIRYLGLAAFEITNDRGKKVLIDPFLDDNPVSPIKSDQLKQVDLILVTHAAFDHLGDAAKIAKRFGAPVICGSDVRAYLLKQGLPAEKLIGTIWGVTVEQAGMKVKSVESRHWSSMIAPDGTFYSGPPMGFILYADPGVRVYHSGDTVLFGDLKLLGELYRPNIALLNVSTGEITSGPFAEPTHLFTGEMTPYEAALAAQWLGAEYAIPMHFLDCNEDVETFVDVISKMAPDGKRFVRPVVLKPGETFTCQGKEAD
jgi:L-ascorbate metabolism protein UlaG (beta-lactamase superfamily)